MAQVPGEGGGVTAEVGDSGRASRLDRGQGFRLQAPAGGIHKQVGGGDRLRVGLEPLAQHVSHGAAFELGHSLQSIEGCVASGQLHGGCMLFQSVDPPATLGERQGEGTDAAVGIDELPGPMVAPIGEGLQQRGQHGFGLAGVHLKKGVGADAVPQTGESLL